MKKSYLLCLLAALTALCLLLSGCTDASSDGSATTSGETETETEAPQPRNELTEMLLSAEYKLVRADAASEQFKKMTSELKKNLDAKLGKSVTPMTDWVRTGTDPDSEYPYEILFGKTNRSALSEEIAALGLLDYLIAASGTRLVIAAGSDFALRNAAERLPELLDAEELSLPIHFIGTAEGGDTPVKLKIGSYNIKNGQDVGYDYAVLAADILEAGLDVCGLQEVDQMTTRNGGKDTMKLLSEATGYPYYEFAKSINFKGGQYGTGILSKYPIITFDVVLLESDGNEQRAYGHAVLNVNGTLVDFYNTHLSYESLPTRTKQFAALAEELAGKTRWALTADFNTEDFSEFSCIADSLLVNNAENKMLSFSGKSAIDNIVLPSGASVEASGCFNQVSHSDHYMIWAEVILP